MAQDIEPAVHRERSIQKCSNEAVRGTLRLLNPAFEYSWRMRTAVTALGRWSICRPVLPRIRASRVESRPDTFNLSAWMCLEFLSHNFGVRERSLTNPGSSFMIRTTSTHGAAGPVKLTRIVDDLVKQIGQKPKSTDAIIYQLDRVCTRLETQPPSAMWVPTELFTPSRCSHVPAASSILGDTSASLGRHALKGTQSLWGVVGDFAGISGGLTRCAAL
jgi:hypothetical protein